MRQITYHAVDAFLNAQPFMRSDTSVFVDSSDVTRMYLFGNCIATRRVRKVGNLIDTTTTEETVVTISNSGWESPTTKERLNGILEMMGDGRRIYQRNTTWYWSGEHWPEDEFPYFQEVKL